MIPLGLDEIVRVISARSIGTTRAVNITGVTIDSRAAATGDLFFALRGTRTDGHDFVADAFERGAYGCVVSRPIEPDDSPVTAGKPVLLVTDVVAALGRLAAYHRQQIAATTIAVTGSNGKSTVRAMIDHVLSTRLTGHGAIKSYNNELGLPLTLLSCDSADAYLVAEIGSNSPGEIAALARMADPQIGVVTGIDPAHLEGLGTVEGVAAEKLSLLDHLREGGLAVVNFDCPLVRGHLAQRHSGQVVTFGCHESADVRVSDVEQSDDGVRFRLNDRLAVRIPLLGAHNAINAVAALAVCRRMKFGEDEIIEALATFQPLPLRLNMRRIGPLRVLEDCYNANPGSLRAAAAVLCAADDARRRIAVLGDMMELGEQTAAWHERAGRELADAGVDWIVGVGEQMRAVAVGAKSAGHGTQTTCYPTTDAVCEELPQRLSEGDLVLVKGSRSMQLERLVTVIDAAWQNRPPGAGGQPPDVAPSADAGNVARAVSGA